MKVFRETLKKILDWEKWNPEDKEKAKKIDRFAAFWMPYVQLVLVAYLVLSITSPGFKTEYGRKLYAPLVETAYACQNLQVVCHDNSAVFLKVNNKTWHSNSSEPIPLFSSTETNKNFSDVTVPYGQG